MTIRLRRCFHKFWSPLLVLPIIVWITGCGDGPSGSKSTTASRQPANSAPVKVQQAEADPAVSAEDGGAGFTGEGWMTGKAEYVGDSRAVKGGAISASIPEWPGNLRMAGTGYNTYLNYLVKDLCYLGLLSLDPNTLEFYPGLASHWWISEDKMTYRFRIDPRAIWSDGKPVVAQDVIASFKLQMDETLLDPSFVLTFSKLNEPVAKSKYIVEVTAKEKNWRNFLYFSGMMIFPAHEIASITGKDYLDRYNYAYTAFSGPYKVNPEDIKKGESLTLTRRDDYWAKDDKWNVGFYNFDKIRFIVVLDPELAYEKVCKGELDFTMVQKAEHWVEDLPKRDAVKNGWLVRQKIFTDAPIGISGIAINSRKPPLDDVRVRKALQLLLDRETLIKKLAYNEYLPMDSYHQGGEYQNPNNEVLRYDPKRAIELLAEAGWKERGPDGVLKKGADRLSLKLAWYNPAIEKYLTNYKETSREAGVEIVLERIDREALWKNLMERKFQLCMMAWGALVFPNPETALHSKLADVNDNNNITGFKNARCDELFKKYDVAFTQEERRNIIREIDGIMFKEHPYVLWWYQPCQRVIYWNKFGLPEYGLPRTLEWESAFFSWWVDPQKEQALKEARRNTKPLTPPPVENHYWAKRREQQQARAN